MNNKDNAGSSSKPLIFSNQDLIDQSDRLSDAIYNKDVEEVRRLAYNQISNMDYLRGFPPFS